jgi:hypothetical protein
MSEILEATPFCTNSFFLHVVPNLSGTTGPMHNVTQTFNWNEPLDSGRLP